MATLDELAAGALKKTVEEHGEEWIEKGLEVARGLIPPKESSSGIVSGASVASHHAIDVLAKHKGDLAHLGGYGLQALLGKLAIGDDQGALMVYLRDEASWDELFAASAAASTETENEKREREAMKAKALEILKEIGAVAKVALPLVLAAI